MRQWFDKPSVHECKDHLHGQTCVFDDDDGDLLDEDHISDRLIGIASVEDKVSPLNSKQSASTSDNQHTTRNPTCLQS